MYFMCNRSYELVKCLSLRHAVFVYMPRVSMVSNLRLKLQSLIFWPLQYQKKVSILTNYLKKFKKPIYTGRIDHLPKLKIFKVNKDKFFLANEKNKPKCIMVMLSKVDRLVSSPE